MRVEVLTVPDCPNGPVLAERLVEVLSNRSGIEVAHRVVTDEDEAGRLGMHGSPTLLVDGRDPFAAPDTPASLSCRLYRDTDGTLGGAPSLADLRRALEAPSAGRRELVYPLGRAGRGRLAPVERGLRALQQAVLRSFAAAGRPPTIGSLKLVAAPYRIPVAEVVAELAAEDFLGTDENGQIVVAYPFSATPTDHVVHIADGPVVWAMCAIDALGIPAMLGRDALITSTDPVSGIPIRVEFAAGTVSWWPHSTVVYYGACEQAGPASAVCCGYLRFFTDHAAAASWAEQHSEVRGAVLEQAQAVCLGADIFGPLLTE